MFQIIIIEIPQNNVTLPLLPEDAERISSTVERLRITVSRLTESHIKTINRFAWKLPRKIRKDKGIPRK